MAQEGNSDLSMKFSTLNVNAMEFVPSFCTNSPPSAGAPAETTTPAGTPVDEPATPVESAVQDASPTKTEAEPPVSVAAPTEPIADKSPDNPGAFKLSFFLVHLKKKERNILSSDVKRVNACRST